jgi:hypothetical protein
VFSTPSREIIPATTKTNSSRYPHSRKDIMPLLLVTFDPNKPGQNNSKLLNEIMSYSNVRLSESSYAIITDKTPSAVCEELKKHIDTNAGLYIINLKRPYAGYGSTLVTDWLKKELRD